MITIERKVKMNKENNGNTSMIIIIVVIVLLIIGGIVYFTMTNKEDTTLDDTNITENEDIDDNETVVDVTGSYSGNYDDEDESIVDDAEDVITNNQEKIELVLEDDGTARLAFSKTVQEGTYSLENQKVTVTINNSEDEQKTNKTYEFTVNDDETLTYSSDDKTATLDKVDNDELEYIK